jgi:hypothetical protein
MPKDRILNKPEHGAKCNSIDEAALRQRLRHEEPPRGSGRRQSAILIAVHAEVGLCWHVLDVRSDSNKRFSISSFKEPYPLHDDDFRTSALQLGSALVLCLSTHRLDMDGPPGSRMVPTLIDRLLRTAIEQV